MLWWKCWILISMLSGSCTWEGRMYVKDECEWYRSAGRSKLYIERFESQSLSFYNVEVIEERCLLSLLIRDEDYSWKLFVDGSHLKTSCDYATFYLDRVKMSCANMSRIMVASNFTVVIDHIAPTTVAEYVTVTSFYEFEEDCDKDDREKCCTAETESRKYTLCDTNRCIDPALVCDDVQHCVDGGDEAGWCHVWVWWVWMLMALAVTLGVAVVATSVKIVKKIRKRKR